MDILQFVAPFLLLSAGLAALGVDEYRYNPHCRVAADELGRSFWRVCCHVARAYEAVKNTVINYIIDAIVAALAARRVKPTIYYATISGIDATDILKWYYATDKYLTAGSLYRWLVRFRKPALLEDVRMVQCRDNGYYESCINLRDQIDCVDGAEVDDIGLDSSIFRPRRW